MENWVVLISPEFSQEFNDIIDYIEYKLLSPDTALKIKNNILTNIKQLNTMPLRFPLCDFEPWKTRGLRKINIGNYIVFYMPIENKHEVVVLHIFYGGRDINKILTDKKQGG